jgi:hypothetical protein
MMSNNSKRGVRDQRLERYADWLDTKFRIPGTQITFGLDFIMGLIPGVGDAFGVLLSTGLLLMMIRKGASGRAVALMVLNVLIDGLVGMIPVIGDVFDLFFKANKRNLNIYQDHFEEGKHMGGAGWVILIVVAYIGLTIALFIWMLFSLILWFTGIFS